MSADLYDGNGYPTDDALKRLEHFEGTPAEMAEYVKSLMKMGGAEIHYDGVNEWGKPRKKLRLVTMGWSGCESVIGVLHQTLFHFSFWEMSARGGLYVYDIPEGLWDAEMNWGNPAKLGMTGGLVSSRVGSLDPTTLDELDSGHSRQAREAVEQ